MTGLFNGDIRFIANARSQWNSVTKGYKTVAGSVDMKLGEVNRYDVFAGGLQVFSDRAGDLNFTTTAVSLNAAFLKTIDKGHNFVSFGLQNSFVSNNVDYSKIIAFSNEPQVVNGAPNRINYMDFSAGLNWFYTYDRNNSAYLGVSVFHINKPVVSLYETEDLNESQVLYRKTIVHGGGDFELGKRSTMKPSFIFMDQGPHREITIGSFWKYRTSKRYRYSSNDPESALYFGAWFRWYAEKDIKGADAIAAAVRLDFENTFITFSFDINVSTYNRASGGRGGPELSVIKILDINRNRRRPSKVRCPAF